MLLGSRGAGAAEAFGVADEVDVHIGTMSKALGAHGGFVACRADIKTLLLNKGRSYVFSTAPPAPVVAAAIAALQVNEEVTAFQKLAIIVLQLSMPSLKLSFELVFGEVTPRPARRTHLQVSRP